MRREIFVACIVATGGILAAFSAANAQVPQAGDQKQGETAKKPSDVPLSKKLDKNEGVLKPPRGIDPEIHQQPPARTGDKMPVIIPPGEPGGDQSVQPK
ncbi:MAG: hypothetical protein JSR99_10105 [Proteobacteria bacterium]|nr:hypothetical protein [Pseudomonadota bacterium]